MPRSPAPARAARPRASFYLKTTTPAPGAQNVPPNTTISLTFSAPVSLRRATPMLSPDIAGKWVQTNATTLSYALASPLIPSSQVTVTIPGGSHGLRSADGATLTSSHSVAFGVAAGDTLRLQQLLAQLNYLPGGVRPQRPRPEKGRPGRGPARVVLVALAQPAHRSSRPSGRRAPRT